MYNVVKTLIVAALTFACVACSSDDKRADAASGLLDKARNYAESRKYDSALILLDSLDKAYRDCIDQRREATVLRLNVLASMTRDSIVFYESQIVGINSEIEELSPRFRKIKLEGTAGFVVDSLTFKGDEMNRTCIQARIDDKDNCYLIANLQGRKIGLTGIAMKNISTTPVQCIEVEGSELISIPQSVASPILDGISDKSEPRGIVIELKGTKGVSKVNLNEKDARAIADTWRYAKALQLKRLISIRLERLERQLASLNDQLANKEN